MHQKVYNVKMPKMTKSITQEVLFKIYLKVNQVIYSSLPIYSLNFKALASIVFFFNILLTRFHSNVLKGHNSGKGHKPDGKKNVQLFFHEESIYEISKP